MSVMQIQEVNFKNEVRNTPGGAKVLNCFLCGTCTAGCPVSEVDNSYNPRKIMRKILLNQKDEVLKSAEIWKCYQCHTCVSHCPQDVRFADVVRSLRELAVEEGVVPASVITEIDELNAEFKKGLIAKVSEVLSKNGLK